jgi:hypothetical protein
MLERACDFSGKCTLSRQPKSDSGGISDSSEKAAWILLCGREAPDGLKARCRARAAYVFDRDDGKSPRSMSKAKEGFAVKR